MMSDVNAKLLAAAELAYEALEDRYDGAPDAHCGWMVGALGALNNAIDEVRAQSEDDAQPVDTEWLQSLGFMATFLPAAEASRLALVVFSDPWVWPDGEVLLVYSDDGSYGFWERPLDADGEWHAFHNSFPKWKTRGDVRRWLGGLGQLPLRELPPSRLPHAER